MPFNWVNLWPLHRGCCKGVRWSSSKPFVRAFVNSNFDFKGDKAYGSIDPSVWMRSKQIMKAGGEALSTRAYQLWVMKNNKYPW